MLIFFFFCLAISNCALSGVRETETRLLRPQRLLYKQAFAWCLNIPKRSLPRNRENAPSSVVRIPKMYRLQHYHRHWRLLPNMLNKHHLKVNLNYVLSFFTSSVINITLGVFTLSSNVRVRILVPFWARLWAGFAKIVPPHALTVLLETYFFLHLLF